MRFLNAFCILGILLAPFTPVYASFQSRASFTFSLETVSSSSHFLLTRENEGLCDPALSLVFELPSSVTVKYMANGVLFTAVKDEQQLPLVIQGFCSLERDIALKTEASSLYGVPPLLLLEETLISGSTHIDGHLFFPSKGDTLFIQAWEERLVVNSQSHPEQTQANGWTLIHLLSWQEFWFVTNSGMQVPHQCHTFSQLFFRPQEKGVCRGKEEITFRSETFPLLSGWQEDSLPGENSP